MRRARLSIRSKVLLLTLGISALGIVSVAFLLFSKHVDTTRERAQDDLKVFASTLAGYASAPLVFDDQEGALSILLGLRSNPKVTSAALFDAHGQVFANYSIDGEALPSRRQEDWSGVDASGRLVACKQVQHRGEALGAVCVAGSTRVVERALAEDFRGVALLCLALIAICGALAYRLHALVTRPLGRLASAMRTISEGGDLSVRVHYSVRDEVGALCEYFNSMLDEMQARGDARDRMRTRLEALVRALPDLVFVYDEHGTFVEAWTHAKRAVLPRAEDYVGKHVRDVLPRDVAESISTAIRITLQTGSSQRLEYELPFPDGARCYEGVVTPLVDGTSERRYVLYVARDVSERKRLEEQFRQAQRMEAIGQLAGGVAHDFNNLLTGIVGYTEIAIQRVGERGELKQVLEICKRAADLVSQLLAFSRRRQMSPSALDANQVMQQVADLSARTVGPQIRIELALANEPCMVEGDRSQLESAILNLAVNARDAMPDGGVLRFSTRIADGGAPVGQLPSETYVEMAVADTGHGIAPELQKRIWEPFFTTKPAGKGTGLGLAAVYGTVQSHGGSVELESKLGQGSTFRIRLPRIDGVALGAGHVEQEAPSGTGHVMVVDDEEMVRVTATQLLESLGYTVSAFGSGAEAVAYYLEHASEVTATLLDLVMPQMNGAETAARLKAIRPDAIILIASGFNPLDAEALASMGAAAFMSKPYTRRELAQRLRHLLHPSIP